MVLIILRLAKRWRKLVCVALPFVKASCEVGTGLDIMEFACWLNLGVKGPLKLLSFQNSFESPSPSFSTNIPLCDETWHASNSTPTLAHSTSPLEAAHKIPPLLHKSTKILPTEAKFLPLCFPPPSPLPYLMSFVVSRGLRDPLGVPIPKLL